MPFGETWREDTIIHRGIESIGADPVFQTLFCHGGEMGPLVKTVMQFVRYSWALMKFIVGH